MGEKMAKQRSLEHLSGLKEFKVLFLSPPFLGSFTYYFFL